MKLTRNSLSIAALAVVALTLTGCQDQTRVQARGGAPGALVAPLGPVGPGTPVPAQPEPVTAFCPAPPEEAATIYQSVAGRVVILDAGHGGDDEGATHYGLVEKEVNLDLALRTAELLRRQGVIVHLTRQSDVFVPLPERSAYANQTPNAAFVSIHVNASDRNPAASGVESFVITAQYSDAERAREAARRYRMNGGEGGSLALASLTASCRAKGPELAQTLQRSLCARLGEADRGVKPGNLAVLRETYFCPAVLVEVGFMSHARTAARMKTPEWRQHTAEALSEGIVDFLRRAG